jgi:ribose transport system ATP-binding protein
MRSILAARGLTKRFPGVMALDGVDLDLNENEVVGLVGQNGSGKSTLLRAIAGIQEPDAGEIRLRGQPVRLKSALEAARLGIGMVHQEQSLIPNLSVAENIFLDKSHAGKRLGWYSWKTLCAAARCQLEKVDLDVDPKSPVEELTFAQRQMVELAKVLSMEELITDRLVILFDEPTSVLAPAEIKALFCQIRRLRSRSAILFVSHRLDEVLEISDRVVVMTDGSKAAEGLTSAMSKGQLYHLMVGRHRKVPQPIGDPAAKAKAPVALRCQNLTSDRYFRGVNLALRQGEILGLVGVLGSGAEEVCRAIFGAQRNVRGTIEIAGKRVPIRSPSDAVRVGLGYIPADRKGEALLRGRTLIENIVLTFGLEYGHFGFLINRRREKRESLAWIARLKVKARSADERIERLSGGNQQKVVVGKWLLSSRLKVLLLDHPARGLDAGAKDDLFETIRQAARGGLSVIFVADTVEEILELSDAIVVMKDGCITASFELSEAGRPSEEQIVRAMV